MAYANLRLFQGIVAFDIGLRLIGDRQGLRRVDIERHEGFAVTRTMQQVQHMRLGRHAGRQRHVDHSTDLAQNTRGKAQTWVNSQWKYLVMAGQFSVAINIARIARRTDLEDNRVAFTICGAYKLAGTRHLTKRQEMMRFFDKIFGHKTSNKTQGADDFFDQYCNDKPSHQNAIDILPGWNSAFPGPERLNAGNHALFADPRIDWAVKQAGSIKDCKVLEVGPLEGMHTFMLNKHRPASIDAIEANKMCFLRCLVSKEILGIDRAHFYLGDALKWLEEEDCKYDLGVASGVLYHMADPGYFLSLLARRCDQIFIWTHYFDEAAMPVDDVRRKAFNGTIETKTIAGVSVRYYERHYFNANAKNEFCGGMKDRHYWMHRDDILSLLKALGYSDIAITQEDANHRGGPCFCLFAKRDAPATKA